MSSAISASTGVSPTQTITINNVVPIHNDDTSLLEEKSIMLLMSYTHSYTIDLNPNLYICIIATYLLISMRIHIRHH